MRRLGLVTASLLFVLTGCGGTASASRPPSPSPASVSRAGVSPAPSDVRRDDHQEGAAFTTPSGNITCWLDTGVEYQDGSQVVGCAIDAKTWASPRSPCPGSAYGDAIEVAGAGRARFFCQHDISSCFTPLLRDANDCHGPSGLWWRRPGDPTVTAPGGGQEAVLPYGTSVRIGALQCTSRTAGVTCSDLETGRGFTMSRERYTLTPS